MRVAPELRQAALRRRTFASCEAWLRQIRQRRRALPLGPIELTVFSAVYAWPCTHAVLAAFCVGRIRRLSALFSATVTGLR